MSFWLQNVVFCLSAVCRQLRQPVTMETKCTSHKLLLIINSKYKVCTIKFTLYWVPFYCANRWYSFIINVQLKAAGSAQTFLQHYCAALVIESSYFDTNISSLVISSTVGERNLYQHTVLKQSPNPLWFGPHVDCPLHPLGNGWNLHTHLWKTVAQVYNVDYQKKTTTDQN